MVQDDATFGAPGGEPTPTPEAAPPIAADFMSSIMARLARQDEVQKTTNDQLAALVAALTAPDGQTSRPQQIRRRLFNTNPTATGGDHISDDSEPNETLLANHPPVDSSANEEQPANRRRIEVILSQETLSSDDENDDTPVLEDLRDVLKRKFESENSNSSTRNNLRTTLNARKSQRISGVDPDPEERSNGDLREKLNVGACDLRIRLNLAATVGSSTRVGTWTREATAGGEGTSLFPTSLVVSSSISCDGDVSSTLLSSSSSVFSSFRRRIRDEDRILDAHVPGLFLSNRSVAYLKSIGANQHGDQDVLNNLIEVRSSDRTDQTDRAVPRTSRLELRLEPRPDDLTDRTTARLPGPTRHSKTHGRARLSLGREETKDGHAFLSGGPSGQSRKRPYLYPLQVNTSFPLDLCVISSNGSRLLLCWTGASHPATNWLREYQQPSASAVRPFNPPFLPLLDLCVISSNRSRLLLCWTGASHPATNWLREYQQPSASAVRPFNPPFLPLLDLCVISSNNRSSVVSRDSPPLLCHHSIHQFSLLASSYP
ncbi:hypothetical protein DY000_02060804 [Brassica cretica]|uniref:Uncharacterized protein n=1 Tax=Brassica cretica TaxID=69181 RepID=A0ABQ7B3E5_BRACR|nr:hypothetical protein DY000_02060804 [Brassica cretica]